MKKLIIAAIAIAAGLIANAENIKVVEKDKTGHVVTNTYDAVEYSNKIAKDNVGKTWKSIDARVLRQLADASTISSCDEILSQAKYYTVSPKFPKCNKNLDKMFLECIPNTKSLVEDKSSNSSFVKVIVVNLYKDKTLYQWTIDCILRNAPKLIKMQLRKEGKSFFEVDGKNPVQERANILTAALNAKRLAGFNNAMALCGYDYGIDYESLLLSEEEVKTLCDDVFYGRKEFSKRMCEKLKTHLGVEEYNAFVKKYND